MNTMEQKTLRETVKDFLNHHRKAVFAILDDEGLPATSLMLYVADDDLNIYFGTRKAFSKYGHVLAKPVVSLSVIEEVLDPLKVVDMRGVATEVSKEEFDTVYAYFKSKNDAKYYVEGAEDFVMFKIKPDFVRWLDAESGELSIVNLDEI